MTLICICREKEPSLLPNENILMVEPNITINDLTALLGINRSAVQKQLDLLERKGYILRSFRADSKWYLAITPSI